MTSNASEAARNAIHALVRQVPAGRVVTYGQVAALAGLPGRARLVGRSLGSEDANGVALPWYRVLNAAGRISVPSPSREMQAKLLRAEGVEVKDGRVDLKKYQWRQHGPSPLLD